MQIASAHQAISGDGSLMTICELEPWVLAVGSAALAEMDFITADRRVGFGAAGFGQ